MFDVTLWPSLLLTMSLW